MAVSTAVKLMQHVQESGSVVPKKIGGYRRHKLGPYDAVVRELATPSFQARPAFAQQMPRERLGTPLSFSVGQRPQRGSG